MSDYLLKGISYIQTVSVCLFSLFSLDEDIYGWLFIIFITPIDFI